MAVFFSVTDNTTTVSKNDNLKSNWKPDLRYEIFAAMNIYHT